LAPVVYFLGRLLSLPTRALIGLANVLLPGKGLKQGPFVSEEDIRTIAGVGARGRQHRDARARADPLDLHLRRDGGARGDGAAPGHRGGRDVAAAARGGGRDARARLFARPGLPRGPRSLRGRRAREGRPARIASGTARPAPRARDAPGALRPRLEEGRGAAARGAAAEVPRRSGDRRVRLA